METTDDDVFACLESRSVTEKVANSILRATKIASLRFTGLEDDVAQEAAIKVFVMVRNGDILPGNARTFFGFVKRVAVYTGLSIIRKRSRRGDVRLGFDPVVDVQENDLFELSDEIKKEKYSCVKDLVDGYKYHEIAARHRIPIGTVRSRINRFRKELKKWV